MIYIKKIKPEITIKLKIYESQMQRAFFKWLKFMPAINDLTFAIPNAGKRKAKSGALMKSEGMKAGVPDIQVCIPTSKYHGLFIELKVGKNEPTDLQNRMMNILSKAGYKCVVIWDDWVLVKRELLHYLEGTPYV